MGCCTGLVKYILFALNIIFWLAGIAFLGVGIWIAVDPNVKSVVTVAGISIYAGYVSFIVIGCVMFLIGFCGCCGAIKENKCLLGTYFTFVLLIFLTQLGIAIWGFAYHSSLESAIQKGLNKSIPINSSDANEANAVKTIQSFFKCCGLMNGCEDWFNSTAEGCGCDNKTATAKSDNTTTCMLGGNTGTCVNTKGDRVYMYTTDCYDAIVKFIQDNIVAIAGVAIGIAVFEILLMTFAIITCKSKDKYTTV